MRAFLYSGLMRNAGHPGYGNAIFGRFLFENENLKEKFFKIFKNLI